MGTHDERWFHLVRHPLAVRRLSVEQVEDVTPRMRRVTLSGPELAGFTTLAPEDHVKLFFPAPGAEEPIVPRVGPLGVLLPFGAGGKPVSRDYTLRHHDPAQNRLAIDFFLHGRGVASGWVERARPGSRLGVAGPRGSYVLNASFAWQLCIGDETALPEIARRIEEAPAGTRVFAVLGVENVAERQRFETAARLELEWVERARDGSGLTRGLIDALARRSQPRPSRGNRGLMLPRSRSKRLRLGATPATARRGSDPHTTNRLVDTYLERLGRSATSQRRAILEVLVTTGGHMTVPVLRDLASKKSPGISYSTVYRTLAQLSSSGIVRNHEFGDGCVSYELAAGSEHHDHLICIGCAAVLEFSIPEMPLLQHKVASDHGFELTHQRHVLYGICPECRRNRSDSRANATT